MAFDVGNMDIDLVEVKEEDTTDEDKILTWDTSETVKHRKVKGERLAFDSKSERYAKSKKRTCWSERDTQVLLDLWAERANDLRRAKRNGHIHKEMSIQMNHKFSPYEVHVKIRNLTQKYREEKRELESPAGNPTNWKLYDAVDKIIGGTNPSNTAEVAESFLFENTSDASCQPSLESQPLPSLESQPLPSSPALPPSPPSPQSRFEPIPTSAAAVSSTAGKRKNHLGEVVKMIKEQNVLLKTVVDDSQLLSTVIVNAIREQNELSKEFITLMKTLVEKI